MTVRKRYKHTISQGVISGKDRKKEPLVEQQPEVGNRGVLRRMNDAGKKEPVKNLGRMASRLQ